MEDLEADQNDFRAARRRGGPVAQMVVRAVNAEMAGQPVDQVYRVLNGRLHAAGEALDAEEIWEYADTISDATSRTPGDEAS